MKGVVLCLCMGAMACEAAGVRFALDERTGAICGLSDGTGRAIVTRLENVYRLMSVRGDAEAVESDDRIVSQSRAGVTNSFVCTNPKLPELRIEKHYWPEGAALKRRLTFVNRGTNSLYLTPFVTCGLAAEFQTNVWHFGAGYIGPFKPFPAVPKARPVNEYRQSSKGLVFVHPEDSRAGFSHLRTKIDETTVFPWWHSTIGHYREYHDRLWYLPDGYRMGLGTFGLYPGRPVSVTERFDAFGGGAFGFFDDVFARDPDFAAELKRLPAPPAWIENLFVNVDDLNADAVRWLAEMSDEGDILLHLGPCHGACFCWGDYRTQDGFRTSAGGRATRDELKSHIATLKAISPRVHVSIYNILISTSYFSKIFREHPEWYRTHDREGNADSLFPGLEKNWQTMWGHPACRAWYVDMLSAFARDLELDTVYIDELQMTNTIDWPRDCLTRDDDSVKFWQALVPKFKEQGLMFFANGSGLPYADLNYMESPHELAPRRWRDWAGVGWGIGMMNRLRPGQRTILLYWTPDVDYANRVLALGWIPRTHFFNDTDLPVTRAVHQAGNLLPVDARYAPDWKRDAATDVESHVVRREKGVDVLCSFINRAPHAADISVAIALDSLGFRPADRINVWKTNLDLSRAGAVAGELKSDRTLKENWRTRGLVQGARLTDPELVYSGCATGRLNHVVRALGTNCMEQFLVTPSPAALFAVDDLPLNHFWTEQRAARIEGRRVRLEKKADVILLDRVHEFADVTANGRPIATRRVEIKGLSAQVFTLAPGEWRLDWREVPRPEAAAETVTLPRTTYTREINDVTAASGERDGVILSRKGVYVSSTDVSNLLQKELPVSVAAADAAHWRLTAGTSRRETFVDTLENFAGFELSGAKTLRGRFTHTFADAISIMPGHVARGDDAHHIRNGADVVFTGLVLDYRAGGRYVKRVAVSTGLYSAKNSLVTPPWGTGRRPDVALDAGDWIDEPSGRTFTLDLTKHAPPDWDGTVFVSLGSSRIQVGRAMTLEILGFNAPDATDRIEPFNNVEARQAPAPVKSRPLKSKPRSLTRIDASEWASWARVENFVKIGSGRVKANTRAYLAHDYEYLYVGVEADEPGRSPLVPQETAEQNEHVEVLVRCPDRVTYQVIADAKGRFSHYRDLVPSSAAKGIVSHGEIVPGRGWRVFIALPVNALKFNMQRTPVEVRYAITRVRRDPAELSASVPLDGIFDYPNYGTLILDFNW